MGMAGVKIKFAVFVAALAWSGYCPAPSNSASPVAVGIAQTLFRHLVTFGLVTSVEWERTWGLGALRKLLAIHSPERIVDERITHEIVRRADYNLHIVRPVYLDVEFASRNAAAVLFIHGGGWTIGDVSMNYRHLTEMAISTGAVILSPDYRLSPEHPYPAALEDCYDSVNYISENAKALRINEIIITGDSAGGQLTITTALKVLDAGRVSLTGIMPIYPVTQMVSVDLPSYKRNDKYLLSRYQMAAFFASYLNGGKKAVRATMSGNVTKSAIASDPNIRHYLGGIEISEEMSTTNDHAPIHYTQSPLFAPDDLLAKLPNCVIYVSEHDVLHDDGVLLHQRLVKLGVQSKLVEWSGAIHAQVALSAQFAPVEVDPAATRQVAGYLKDLRYMINKGK